MSRGEGRLSRWSRRKALARRGRPEREPEEQAAPEGPEDRSPAAAEEPEPTPEEEAELLRKLDLPPPESLKPGDDFSAFMKHAVPDQLRRRALRVLWRSDPILANVDGLVDYGEDFTDAATVVANLKTAYVVGHGARPIEEEPEEGAETAEAGEGVAPPEEETAADVEEKVAEEELAPSPADEPAEVEIVALPTNDRIEGAIRTTDAAAAPSSPGRRRMAFRFEGE